MSLNGIPRSLYIHELRLPRSRFFFYSAFVWRSPLCKKYDAHNGGQDTGSPAYIGIRDRLHASRLSFRGLAVAHVRTACRKGN